METRITINATVNASIEKYGVVGQNLNILLNGILQTQVGIALTQKTI